MALNSRSRNGNKLIHQSRADSRKLCLISGEKTCELVDLSGNDTQMRKIHPNAFSKKRGDEGLLENRSKGRKKKNFET